MKPYSHYEEMMSHPRIEDHQETIWAEDGTGGLVQRQELNHATYDAAMDQYRDHPRQQVQNFSEDLVADLGLQDHPMRLQLSGLAFLLARQEDGYAGVHSVARQLQELLASPASYLSPLELAYRKLSSTQSTLLKELK